MIGALQSINTAAVTRISKVGKSNLTQNMLITDNSRVKEVSDKSFKKVGSHLLDMKSAKNISLGLKVDKIG